MEKITKLSFSELPVYFESAPSVANQNLACFSVPKNGKKKRIGLNALKIKNEISPKEQ